MIGFGLPGGTEWIIILIVALLIFGSRLPQVMRSVGKSIQEFKKGLNEAEDEVNKAVEEEPDKELKG
ncbi:MAG: twin-arginine translocase TatA/TatE family subunit [Planctomycetota bacterium]